MKWRIAIGLLFACAVRLMAQEFTYIDWKQVSVDTLPFYHTQVLPLQSSESSDHYTVRLLYPDYLPLNAEESRCVEHWGMDIPEQIQVDCHVAVSRKQPMLDVSFLPFVKRDGKYWKLNSYKISIEHTTPKKRTGGQPVRTPLQRYAENSVLASGRWVKIAIAKDGVYRLTPSDLARMGFRDVSRVKLYGYGGHVQSEMLDADVDFDDLEEVPLYRDSKGLLFYGNGLVAWSNPDSRGILTHSVNTYARKACYFLTEGDSPLTLQTETATATAPNVITSTPCGVLYHMEEYAWYESGRQFFESQNYSSNPVKNYSLQTPDPVEGEDASLCVYFSAANKFATTEVQVYVDGESKGTMSLSKLPGDGYTAATTYKKRISFSEIHDGVTYVTLRSQQGVDARLGFLELSYLRMLRMTTPYLYIRQRDDEPALFRIQKNGRKDVRLWRLGKRGVPMCEMAGKTVDQHYEVVVDDASEEYVAVDVSADYPTPEFIAEIPAQNLHATPAMDMVIVIPASGHLAEQAERLAEAHRRLDGLRVMVVRADQLYNEFSSGTPDATAYRRFMKMLYDRAETDRDMPRYLLLFGDGIWDNRMITPAMYGRSPDDYLLCYESENSLSHTSSYVMEDYFGLLDDGEGKDLLRDKSDLGVGRFPVTTVADAKIMVDKTIDYMENKYAGAWKNVLCFLGDDGDNNQHLEMAEDLALMVEEEYPELQVNRIHWDAYKRISSTTSNSYPGVEQDIAKQMEEGCLMMNYAGHGNPRSMSHELSIELEDFNGFTSPKVPLWVTAACDIMPFDMTGSNIGETAVLHPTGAAIAFLGTTRTVYATRNSIMNRYFTRYVLKDGNTIGDALRLAKVNLLTSGSSGGTDFTANKLHYVLLGDPALRLGKPRYDIVVEQINGIDVTQQGAMAQLKASDLAVVTGYVADEAGNCLADYTGSIEMMVYDSESLITCLNNDGYSDEPFTFMKRDKKLYEGGDSVRNGRFEIRFPVPMDIKYSDKTGRVVFYAIDNDRVREASGYSEQFIVGGSGSEFADDKEGPSILAYLNDDSFASGATVNRTPLFVAHLQDESGINTSGTAVGHDLEIVIDGRSDMTFKLNSYYKNQWGDYTKGDLAFVLPELEDGAHTLLFRAWDTMNNASTLAFDFHVDGSMKPDMMSLTATENPAREHTTFIVRYDRPGTVCDFTLQVFDFAGRMLWTHTEQGTSTDGVYAIDWDLTTSSGMPLHTGVYLCRVSLKDGDAESVSKTNKIIVLRNK